MDIDEKIDLVREVGEEIINEEELRNLFETKENPVAYDGFEPSGRIHIAQGLLRSINVNKLIKAGIHFKFWVADWFAYLNNKMDGDMKKIRTLGKYFIEVWKASGMDLKNVEFIWASEFIRENPDYWDTVLKLSKDATIKRVLRCGQIMGREESKSNPASYIFYPLMQAADIHHLKADISQLGMDQRKVNMLARDIFPKLGLTPPIAVHHHMLMGLTEIKSDKKGADAAIEKKMSKSNPDSAIFMDDSEEEVKKKFSKAYCPQGQVKDNPVLEYFRYIIFERQKEITIKRPEKFGGDIIFRNYQDLEKKFASKEVHPLDLKNAAAENINKLLQPVRDHFSKDKEAIKLLKEIKKY